jgi:hypothetical protein
MQPCNRIIIPKFIEGSACFERHTVYHQKLQTVFAVSGLYTSGDRLLSRLDSLDNGRSPQEYTNQRLQIQFGAPDDGRYAARNMLSLQ